MAVGDTGSRMLGNTEFYGGLSTDRKIGIENSYYDGTCLDVRKSPSQMTVLPQSREIDDNNVITGLITAMAQTKDGNIWALDEDGKLYKIDASNTVTVISDTPLSSGHGLAYFTTMDALWFTDAGHTVFSYGKIINPQNGERVVSTFEYMEDTSELVANTISTDYAGNYISQPQYPRSPTTDITDPTYYDYNCPTTVSETDADKALFLPGLSPVAQVGIYFKTKGTGTVKVVIHDSNNNLVAQSAEKSADSIVEGTFNYFEVLPDPTSDVSAKNQASVVPWAGDLLEAGGEYHIHVVASASGWVLQSTMENSLYFGMRLKSYGSMLFETYNGKHPVATYKSVYIGNGQYVAELQGQALYNYIDDTMYLPHRLRLDDGFEVCSIATSDEYIVIGAEKYSQDAERSFQAGKLYFWDGESEAPNFSIECNMGSPHCVYNFANITYVIINGALYAYTGGKELVKIRTMKGTDSEYSGVNSTTDVLPNMMTTRREIMLLGFPSTTTSPTTRFGIYGWGSIDKNYPNCFTHNYTVPNATKGQYNTETQTLRIGCVYNFGDSLYYGYEVNGNPALATIDNECGAATQFHWTSLAYDAGSPIMEKMALKVGVYFDALPEGVEITPIYRIDEGNVFPVSSGPVETVQINGETWVKGSHTAKQGEREVFININERIHEFQYGFIGKTTNSMHTPVIKQVCAEIRILNEEKKF